ncbi:MAG: phosphatidylserine decarboxylase [archaeon]
MNIWEVSGTVILALIISFFAFWRFVFLRNPVRMIPKAGIVSPADGKVVAIVRSKRPASLLSKGILGKIRVMTSEVSKSSILVSIMMTPLDVHYQRAPISGVVKKISYRKGRFRNAVSGAGDFRAIDNERNEILISGEISVKVVQIAGLLARRIRCFVRENQKVNKGERIGLINLGSQVSLILPDTVKLRAKCGDRVRAGSSVIAECI